MRWWLNTDAPKIFSVDNAAVKGMDFSALEPDIWMVQWTEGKGEIERQNATGQNLNGLRETFIDIIPYAPLFRQFLELLKAKALLLPQAKKVQVDLIRQIFESKRQAPFHYPVAAGDYYWDATDETLFSSTVPQLQNAIASINTMAAQLNSLISAINTNIVNVGDFLVGQINGNVVNRGNGIWNYLVNGVVPEINAYIVGPHNQFIADVNASCVVAGYNFVVYVNDTVVGYRNYDHPEYNNINNRLRTDAPVMGFVTDIPYHTNGFANMTAGAYASGITRAVYDGTTQFLPLTADFGTIPWTPLTNVSQANSQWIPVGATAPVTVTAAESAAIMSGIAARTNSLNVKKNIKIGEVNALTLLQDVIYYDVTTGW